MAILAGMEPRAAPPITRRQRVPYRVVYFVRGELLTLLAVVHGKRRPGYWRDRVIP